MQLDLIDAELRLLIRLVRHAIDDDRYRASKLDPPKPTAPLPRRR